MSENHETNILDSLLLLIVVISLVAVTLLVSGRFDPLWPVITGIMLFAVLIRVFGLRFALDKKFGPGIAVILLLSVLFRAHPYLYIVGAGDTGLYVNMSSYYTKTGNSLITDEVRKKLNDEQKKFYDRENQYKMGPIPDYGEVEGRHLPIGNFWMYPELKA